MGYSETGNLRDKFDPTVDVFTAEAARQTRVGSITDQDWDDDPADAPMAVVKGPLTVSPSTLKRPATPPPPRVESIAEKVIRISASFANAMLANDKATAEVLRLKDAIRVAMDQEKEAADLAEAARRDLSELVQKLAGQE